MKYWPVIFLIILACNTPDEPAVEYLYPDLAEIRGYQDYYIDDFRSGVYVPEDYTSSKHYPVIIYLHSWSDTSYINLDYYEEPFKSKDPAIVLTPKSPTTENGGGWGNSYSAEIAPNLLSTFELFDRLRATFSIDTSRVYIHGRSAGAFGTYSALLNAPSVFAAAYVEAGAGNLWMAEILSEIPFWIFHGSEDDVINVEGARSMFDAIRAAGGRKVRYSEYQGVGHKVWDFTRKEPTIPVWLLSQRKGDGEHLPPVRKINPTAEITDEGVRLSWNIENEFPVTDDDLWYVRIVRNGTPVMHINSNRKSWVDTVAGRGQSHQYDVYGVNYFFQRSEEPETLTIFRP